MIFVAVGTTGFSTLVRAMDELCPCLGEEVVMQIGSSSYVPEHCESFRFVPSLDPYLERASLVVSHGGLGIVTEAMRHGRRLVAVEDPHQPDRHQREILGVWEQEGHLLWCKDLAQLAQFIERARSHHFCPYVAPPCWIHTLVAEFLEGLR